MLKNHAGSAVVGGAFAVFALCSWFLDFDPGVTMGRNFLEFLVQMLRILPCVFILIGLFEVWVKTDTVERHLGHDSGPISYLWAVLLAGTTVGGLHVALPVAHALYTKRARLGVVLAFVTACGICRVPMTLFEASFLGWRFSLVRLAASLPLLVLSSAALGWWARRRQYRLPDAQSPVAPAS